MKTPVKLTAKSITHRAPAMPITNIAPQRGTDHHSNKYHLKKYFFLNIETPMNDN